MTQLARLKTSVPSEQHKRVAELAAAQGISASQLLAKLVWSAIKDNPVAMLQRPRAEGAVGKGGDAKYTMRLMGVDAVRLEARARARGVTASGYVAKVLRAHLRADPPMPNWELQEVRRVVSELAGIRAALVHLTSHPVAGHALEVSVKDNVLKLLPTLKRVRGTIEGALLANSKSWASPDG